MSRQGLQEACDALGGQAALARELQKRQGDVWYWLNRSKNGLPAEHVLRVERASGVPRYRLRPDLYPPPKRRRGFVHEAAE